LKGLSTLHHRTELGLLFAMLCWNMALLAAMDCWAAACPSWKTRFCTRIDFE